MSKIIKFEKKKKKRNELGLYSVNKNFGGNMEEKKGGKKKNEKIIIYFYLFIQIYFIINRFILTIL